jgi:hypothetical protein
MVQWSESILVRRAALGSLYRRYFVRALIAWAFGLALLPLILVVGHCAQGKRAWLDRKNFTFLLGAAEFGVVVRGVVELTSRQIIVRSKAVWLRHTARAAGYEYDFVQLQRVTPDVLRIESKDSAKQHSVVVGALVNDLDRICDALRELSKRHEIVSPVHAEAERQFAARNGSAAPSGLCPALRHDLGLTPQATI